MICCAESTAKPGTSASRWTASWCGWSKVALLVQLTDLLLEDLQVLQGHFQEPSVHGLELRARAEGITQLFRRSSQPLMGQSRQSCRISFSISQCLQHAPGTNAEQIGD